MFLYELWLDDVISIESNPLLQQVIDTGIVCDSVAFRDSALSYGAIPTLLQIGHVSFITIMSSVSYFFMHSFILLFIFSIDL